MAVHALLISLVLRMVLHIGCTVFQLAMNRAGLCGHAGMVNAGRVIEY